MSVLDELFKALGKMSGVSAGLGFLGTVAAFIGAVIGHAWHTRSKLNKAMLSVKPTPLPPPPTDVELMARLENAELRARLLKCELDQTLLEKKGVTDDYLRAATTINAQTQLIDQLREELGEAYNRDEAGFTRLPAKLPPLRALSYPPVIIEINETPTVRPPKQR